MDMEHFKIIDKVLSQTITYINIKCPQSNEFLALKYFFKFQN